MTPNEVAPMQLWGSSFLPQELHQIEQADTMLSELDRILELDFADELDLLALSNYQYEIGYLSNQLQGIQNTMQFDIPVIDGVPFPEVYGQADQWAPLAQKASPMDTYG